MTYTKDAPFYISVPEENEPQKVIYSAQDVFDTARVQISNNNIPCLQKIIQLLPEVASMKNSDDCGNPLLMYAIHANNLKAVNLILAFTTDLEISDDEIGQTALQYAVIQGHLEIVELLIHCGANIHHQDKSQQTCATLACVKGNLAMLQLLWTLSAGSLALEVENFKGRNPLHIAAINGYFDIVKYLLTLGVDINKQGINGENALILAARLHPEIALFLLEQGANPNCEDKWQQAPLHITLKMPTPWIDLVKLFMDKGANPYQLDNNDATAFDLALDANNPHLLRLLFNREHTQNLMQAIIDDDQVSVHNILTTHQFLELELRVFFLFAVNAQQDEIATVLLDHSNGLQSHYKKTRSAQQDLLIDAQNGVNRKELTKPLYNFFKRDLRSKFVLDRPPFSENKEAILDAFAQISELLCDLPTCIELLQEIDNELKALLPELSKIKAKETRVIRELVWPVSFPDDYQPLDKGGILRKIFRTHLQKHGIETSKQMYNFANFVRKENANELIVTHLSLFKEHILGNGFIHGLYSHYFQWVLIALAIDKGRIVLPEGLNLAKLLQATVQISTKDEASAWVELIDTILGERYTASTDKWRCYEQGAPSSRNTPLRYKFSSPHALASFLYNSDELPHIRGYLIDSLYKNMQKIQYHKNNKGQNCAKINTKLIMVGQAVAFWNFTRFKIGIDNSEIASYYEKRAKTEGKIDLETGIISKSIPKSWGI